MISHLSLNHLTLIDQDNGAASLREILRLYNPDDRDEARKIVESVTSVEFRRGMALIELLVVVAIIIVLAAAGFPLVSKMQEAARSANCISNLRQVGLVINMYASVVRK